MRGWKYWRGWRTGRCRWLRRLICGRSFERRGRSRFFRGSCWRRRAACWTGESKRFCLLNRRGYSAVVMCRSCGEKIECENCAISLTFHKSGDERELAGPARVGARLECHYCGYRRGVPERCPKCESEHLFYLGVGSQQGEERLAELFSGGAARKDGPGYGADAGRYGAAARATAFRERSTCWWGRR